MLKEIGAFIRDFFRPPPPSFNDYLVPPSFTDKELKEYQQILISPVYQKALLIAEQYKPSEYIGVVEGYVTNDNQEAKRLSKIQGWREHYTAMMKIGLPPVEKKSRKEIPVSYQDPEQDFKQTNTDKK